MPPPLQNKETTHAPWQREFFKNVAVFEALGMSSKNAKALLTEFLELSAKTPLPAIMEVFENGDALERVGIHNKQDTKLRDFMIRFLEPLIRDMTVQGIENIKQILELSKKLPVVIVSNHLSHMDALSIYSLLYRGGGGCA